MKKAVIVIDMPVNCYGCPFGDTHRIYEQCWITKQGIQDDMDDLELYEEMPRPKWCPLRPLPEKWERQPYNSQSRVDWKIGYNDCLDDIQGIEDEQERANKWWAEHSSRFD